MKPDISAFPAAKIFFTDLLFFQTILEQHLPLHGAWPGAALP
ncbi:hypothetical protein ACIPEN_13310 [Herbaspirillum chlorophenolicum]|uniref:Uncharacterized protein n=1 Tax=Herbaspirillum chlorophenolicum TaxID=211589 RepID=A0ABW8F0I2_9BURK